MELRNIKSSQHQRIADTGPKPDTGVTSKLSSRESAMDSSESILTDDGWLSKITGFLALGKVSQLHLLEAKERYSSNLKLVEHYYALYASKQNPSDLEREQFEVVRSSRDSLIAARELLTRDQEDLNMLWRELTRIRVLMIEQVLPDSVLPSQVDFCREEAYRLAVSTNSEVNDMLQNLAEATDEHTSKPNQMKRSLRALLERFNTIRVNRIYAQFVRIRTYKVSLFILLLLTSVIIFNQHLVLKNSAFAKQTSAETATNDSLPIQDKTFANHDEKLHEGMGGWHVIGPVMRFLSDRIHKNVLAFVFLGGLAGGYFSVVLRVRDRMLIPGEDAYYAWWVLTKPFVGASGAVVLFVLFHSGFVDIDIVQNLGVETNSRVFGFAFLSGFTERFVFPDFK